MKCLSAKRAYTGKKTVNRIKRIIRNLKSDVLHGVRIRKRGTVILKNRHGILVVQEPNGSWSLPGGGIDRDEPDVVGALRELTEETTVKGKNANYQFEIRGRVHRGRHGRRYVNLYKVYEVTEYENRPKPSHEIRRINYWKPGKHIRLTSTTKKILDAYLKPWRTPQFREYCEYVNCAYGDRNGCGKDRQDLNPIYIPMAYFKDGIPYCDDMHCMDDGH